MVAEQVQGHLSFQDRLTALVFLTAALLVLPGCTLLKANPSADAGFIEEPERMTRKPERYPFHRVWDSGVLTIDNARYSKVMFSPVNTEHILPAHTWDKINLKSRKKVRRDAEKIGDYTKKAFEKAVAKNEDAQLSVTDAPDKSTMVVELALVGLVPAKRIINLSAIVGGILVPGVSAAALLGKGNVAIEARVRDGETNELLATFADRERGKLAPFDVAGLTPYWHAKNRIKEWAKQFAKLMATAEDQKVKDSIPIRLMPW